jgi:hypothetical protein
MMAKITSFTMWSCLLVGGLSLGILSAVLWQWMYWATSPGPCPHELYYSHALFFAVLVMVNGGIYFTLHLLKKR